MNKRAYNKNRRKYRSEGNAWIGVCSSVVYRWSMVANCGGSHVASGCRRNEIKKPDELSKCAKSSVTVFFFPFHPSSWTSLYLWSFLFLCACCLVLISLFRRGGWLQMMETAAGVRVACCCTALPLDWYRSAGQLCFCLNGGWCSLLCGHRRLLPFLMAAVIGFSLWQVRHFGLCWFRVWIRLLLVYFISLNGPSRLLIPNGLAQLILL